MCGIAGWVAWNRELATERHIVEAMTDALACRGPDASGVWISGQAALGHRRLAVVDIQGGNQPMLEVSSAEDVVAITFSGEIYNYRELRRELSKFGHVFKTESDTEVLLRSYLEWGKDLATRLNGMYAFAVWDARTRELFLVRDRLGIKPLYYVKMPTGVIFGSEPKALFEHPSFEAEVDAEGIAELLVLPRARTPGHGVYRGLREVRPGHLVVASARAMRESQYWSLQGARHNADRVNTILDVRNLLEEIVQRQTMADVQVGTLLSGGIDSSTITALAVRELGPDALTYSVELAENDTVFRDAWRPSSDTPYAELVAKYLRTRHTVTRVGAEDLLEVVDSSLEARDLPGWGDLDLSMYLLFKKVRQKCAVALSGEASDEIFGGYLWQNDSRYFWSDSFPWMYGRSQPEVLLRDDLRNAISPHEYAKDRYRQALSEVDYVADESKTARRAREIFYLTMTRWLPALLDRKDRMSMSVGLEVRVPFADHRLVEYMSNVPRSISMGDGVDKSILRHAAIDWLPESIVKRPKSAYPAARIPAYDAGVRRLMNQLISDGDARVYEILDRERVECMMLNDEVPGPITASTRSIAMSYIIALNQWLTRYKVNIRI